MSFIETRNDGDAVVVLVNGNLGGWVRRSRRRSAYPAFQAMTAGGLVARCHSKEEAISYVVANVRLRA
jgi:glutathione synthase/RimK-type ligase-like ATP-grasp enzyme